MQRHEAERLRALRDEELQYERMSMAERVHEAREAGAEDAGFEFGSAPQF